jgi:cytochrome b subunit of formate dehydrogenase
MNVITAISAVALILASGMCLWHPNEFSLNPNEVASFALFCFTTGLAMAFLTVVFTYFGIVLINRSRRQLEYE